MSKTKYLIKNGLNYPTRGGDVRAEAGDVVDNLPVKSVEWLLEQGHIAPVQDKES